MPKEKEKKRVEIDLHGYTVTAAEDRLTYFLDHLPKDIKEVEVVHGYSRGTALKQMVKEDFYHRRIKDKRVTLNIGVTLFHLK